MLEVYTSWYQLAVKALNYTVNNLKEVSFNKVLISGMGGSGIVGDFIKSLAYDSIKIPFYVVKDFRIPAWVDEKTLVISISYSGNTLETLKSVVKAKEKNAIISVISSNGKLLNYAIENELMFIEVEKGYAPRAAFPLLLYSTLKLLKELNLDIIKESEVKESLDILKNANNYIPLCREVAKEILNALPIIIVDSRYEPLGCRFKNELNENAKIIAKYEVIPEWSHNDIVGYEKSPKIFRVIIINPKDSSFYQKIMEEFIVNYLTSEGFKVINLELKGTTFFSKLMYGTLIAGITSVILAKIRGLDPLVTQSISKYKKYVKEVFS